MFVFVFVQILISGLDVFIVGLPYVRRKVSFDFGCDTRHLIAIVTYGRKILFKITGVIALPSSGTVAIAYNFPTVHLSFNLHSPDL